MIHLTNELLFVHIPRTAGTSITRCLLEHALRRGNFDDGVWVTGRIGGVGKHARAAQFVRRIASDEWDRLFKFAVTRDPFAQLESLYFQYIRPTWLDEPGAALSGYQRQFHQYVRRCRRWTFSEWLRADHVGEIAHRGGFWNYYCRGADGSDLGVVPLRHDRLAADWEVVRRRFGVGELPRLNAAPRTRTIEWTPADRGWVEERFREDLRLSQGQGLHEAVDMDDARPSR